jgi:hypothetical protein
MPHEPSSHLAERAPIPIVSGLGPREHVVDIVLAVTTLVDNCTPCAGIMTTAIADDPMRMLTLHELMRGFTNHVEGMEMDEAPDGAAEQIALLPQESREQMVVEGLVWVAHLVGKANGWWESVIQPAP